MEKVKFMKLLFTVMLVSIISLVGCSQNETTPDGEDDTSTGNEQNQGSTNTGEKATLRFSWWGGDSRHQATLEAIDLSMDENPNIVIEAEYGGFDGYQQKLTTSLAGGTEADIMQIDQPWMPDLLSQNSDFFLDIKEYENLIDLSGFSQDFLDDFCIHNEKLISLPTGINALTFLVNKAVLEDAGVNLGENITWDKLLEEGKKVNAKNPENYMINMDGGGSFFFVTRIFLYQLTGKDLINDDYTIGMTKEELETAFTYTKQLYDEKVMIPLEESMIFQGAPQDNPKWNNNQLGSWFNWSSQADQHQWGDNALALPYPQIEGSENSGVLVRPASLFAVSNNTKYPEEAIKFLDFMFNQESGIMALKDSRSIPAVERGRDILVENDLINEEANRAINYAMENPGKPESDLTTNSEVNSAVNSVLENMVYGQYDAAIAAEELYTLLEDVLTNLKDNSQ